MVAKSVFASTKYTRQRRWFLEETRYAYKWQQTDVCQLHWICAAGVVNAPEHNGERESALGNTRAVAGFECACRPSIFYFLQVDTIRN